MTFERRSCRLVPEDYIAIRSNFVGCLENLLRFLHLRALPRIALHALHDSPCAIDLPQPLAQFRKKPRLLQFLDQLRARSQIYVSLAAVWSDPRNLQHRILASQLHRPVCVHRVSCENALKPRLRSNFRDGTKQIRAAPSELPASPHLQQSTPPADGEAGVLTRQARPSALPPTLHPRDPARANPTAPAPVESGRPRPPGTYLRPSTHTI